MNGASQIQWPVFTVLIPLAGAALSFLLGRSAVRTIVISSAFGTILSSVGLASHVWRHGPFRYTIGGWGAPLGIDWQVDGLAVVMIGITAIVGFFVSIYAVEYFFGKDNENNNAQQAYFAPLWLFLWSALDALILSADLFNAYVTLELIGISSVALVTISGGKDALMAGTRYLFIALLGSLSYLMGVAILYSAYGTLDITSVGSLISSHTGIYIAIALITSGLLAKTALFPMHFWLPQAHANAPSPVSAILSGLVVKASLYLTIRLWMNVFSSVMNEGVAMVVGLLGAAAVIWGSVLALRQSRIKMLIAYSTVAQLGYLFLPFPLISNGDGAVFMEDPATINALSAGIYLAVSHAAAKASMFLAAGSVIYALGHDRIEEIGGAGRHMPLTAFAFGLAGISLMGLPPSGGFVGKWLLIAAAFQRGQWWWAIIILAGGLLAAGYVFRIFRQFFIERPGGGMPRRAPLVMEIATLSLAAVSLLLGIAAAYPLAVVKINM